MPVSRDMEVRQDMGAGRCTLILDSGAVRWKTREQEGLRLHWFGREASVRDLAGLLLPGRVPDPAALAPALAGLKGHFAAVLEGSGWTLALVDKVRSIPLFYLEQAGQTLLSNSAEALEQAAGPLEQDPAAELEFRMAGYVTGPRTLRTGLRQLQAGELLFSGPDSAPPAFLRYYLFDAPSLDLDDAGFVDALAQATDAIFARTVEDLAGRRVLLPLSAGLDSRLVLAKLLGHGHDNIQCFSYGPPGNFDAKGAKVVAERMGVPWRFVPYTRDRVRAHFWSEERRSYWRFAGNRCGLPFMVDECALHQMRQAGLLARGDVVVNGQTGDFISGGHMCGYHFPALEPDVAYGPELAEEAVLRKHFSLNSRLWEARRQEVRPEVAAVLGLGPGPHDREALMKAYERWEWQERQSKHVVNGQRSYDFYGLDWLLPLWDDEYVHFWPRAPYRLKVGQELYKRWLQTENPGGLFRDFDLPIWNWQGATMLVLPLAKAAKLLLGARAQRAVYRAFAPFGRYSHRYAPFSVAEHLRTMSIHNKPTSRYAEVWLAENP